MLLRLAHSQNYLAVSPSKEQVTLELGWLDQRNMAVCICVQTVLLLHVLGPR
jgi:hypothetical protein